MSESTAIAPPLRVSDRVAFGLGSASESIHNISFNYFCFFYYVQVLGVPGSLVGAVAATVIVIDAISDPLTGIFSDRLRTRLGRRHPLMLIAAIPLGLCFIALFTPPADQSHWFLALWFLVFATSTRICLTLFAIPHLALGSELDPDQIGRTRTMSWHAAFLWVGGAFCHFLGLTFFFDGPREPGSGMLNSESYPLYGLAWGLVLIAVVLISALATLPRARWLKVPALSETTNLRTLTQDFREIFTNRNFLWLLTGLLLYAITSGIHDVFSSHLALYYFEIPENQFRFYGIGAFIGYLTGFLITVHLHKKVGKVAVLTGSALFSTVASSMAIWLRMLGLFPENGSPFLFSSVFAFVILFYFTQSMLIISAMSLLGDVADEHELNWGKRREGVLYSSRSFFGKAASAVGTVIAGIMLDIINFPLGSDVVPGTVDADIIHNLGINYGIIAVVPGLLATVAYRKCSMTTQYHDKITATLARKGQD